MSGIDFSGWRVPEDLFSDCTVATLLCDDQKSKTRFISRILAAKHRGGRVIAYIDMDSMFTVFLEDQEELPYIEDLYLFRSGGEDLDDVVAGVCSLSPPRIDTVVFDSVTSFYNLQGGGADSSRANRRLGLYLALLSGAVFRSGGRIIFTSMLRARKRKGEESWYLSYAGGRLLRRRSDLILKLSGDAGYLDVSVLKCRDGSLRGVNLHLDFEHV